MKKRIILSLYFCLCLFIAYTQQPVIIAILHDTLQPTVVLCSTRPAPGNKMAKAPRVTKLPVVSRSLTGEPLPDQRNAGVGLFTTFDTDDGLAMDAISFGQNSSICDRLGNLWFGTSGGGVSRYDGQGFTTFTTAQGLANNTVASIAEDRHGNLWFGTDGNGVSRYDGHGFTNFTIAQGLANNSVASILEDHTGNLWFGTNGGGVSKYDGKSFTTFTTAQGLANNRIKSITEDRAGNLWFGTYGGGVSRYDGKSFTTFTTANGLANNYVNSIVEDHSSNLWFGTNGGGVSKYDRQVFTNFTTTQGLANNSVVNIVEDRAGNLWFGTYSGGVSKYDGHGFTTFTTGQGLANNSIRSITEDHAGNLWFGTYSSGVSRYDGQGFTTFHTSQGLASNTVMSILEDRTGNLWFGTYGRGVSKYDGQGFATFTTAQGLANNTVASILEDHTGNLWFGTNGGGVSMYDGQDFITHTTTQGLANNSVVSIAEDRAGNLWFGTYGGGVSRYDGQSFTTFTTVQGLANNTVMSIVEDRAGNVWFGTDGGGVSRYDGKSFTTFTTAHGLANNNVYSIAEDRAGNLWFGTYGRGVSLISVKNLLQKSEIVTFLNIHVANGLPDNGICAIRQDLEDRIIIGTNFGIAVIPAYISQRIAKTGELGEIEGIEIYNQFNGYPVRDVNTGSNNGAMCIDSKGLIWVGHGGNGVTRVDLNSVIKNTIAPTLAIQQVKIEEEDICWYSVASAILELDSTIKSQQEIITYGKLLSDKENKALNSRFLDISFDGITKFYPLPEHLILPYTHNAVSFEFNAIVTSRNYIVNYQYALEQSSIDKIDISRVKKWSPITKKHEAVFNNLKEGRYTFILKAQSPEGIWSEPTLYGFTVLPPWQRTWWAYTLYVLLFLLVITILIKWRERSMRFEKQKLEKKVEVRTAELVKEKKNAELEKNRSNKLLLNILPEEIAKELKSNGNSKAKSHTMVSVMFTDFVDFTKVSQKVSAEILVNEIHHCFCAFDDIVKRHGLEKIKTIGDAYMCAGGIPVSNLTHAKDMTSAAFEIIEFIKHRKTEAPLGNFGGFDIRVGINTGPVVAGVVGNDKFSYDIWGDTVNLAARMESAGKTSMVNISQSTYELIADDPDFTFESRGKIEAKGKGEIEMYFVSKS